MNNEQYQQIVDEAYENYLNKRTTANKDNVRVPHTLANGMKGQISRPYKKEEFINKIKTDKTFSERWGLKIEERELSLEERHKLALPIWKEKYGPLADMMVPTNVDNTPYKIPTRVISFTYNNETIESYE